MSLPNATGRRSVCDQTEDRADLCGLGMRLAFARAGAVWTHAMFHAWR